MRVPGIGRVARWIADAKKREAPRGVVLLYHRVAGPRRDPQWLDVRADRFDAQLALLARTCVPLALDAFDAHRRAGTLPPRAVAVTFDDGYADNLQAAAPALARHGIPATVFVTAGMMGSDREFWWDDLERIVFAPGARHGAFPAGLGVTVDDGGPPSDDDRWTVAAPADPTPRHALYRRLAALLQPLPSAERDAVVAALRTWAQLPVAARPSHRPLTRAELGTLAAQPGITIGAHTMTHPSLARLTPAAQRTEWSECQALLRASTGQGIRFAAYPYGSPSDADAATADVAAACGFDAAFVVADDTAWRGSPSHRVPRCLVRDWDAATLAAQLDRWFAR
jgi:peptidoglycan/xylan/chitin deacetylase (PgdA/CDA1 family)